MKHRGSRLSGLLICLGILFPLQLLQQNVNNVFVLGLRGNAYNGKQNGGGALQSDSPTPGNSGEEKGKEASATKEQFVEKILETEEGNKLFKSLEDLADTKIDKVDISESSAEVASMLEQGVYTSKHAREEAELDQYEKLIPKLRQLLPKIRSHMAQVFNKPQKKGAHEDDAVMLGNIVNLLRSSQAECGGNTVLDSRKIATLLMRPDLDEDNDEFKSKRTGYVPSLQSAAESGESIERVITGTKEIQQFVDDVVSKRRADPSDPNYCDPEAKVCDRRKTAGSCESRLAVDDQGECGSCWAFASSHALSIRQCVDTGKVVPFSEQEILDCSQYDCRGGHGMAFVKWLDQTKHIAAEEDYPHYSGEKKLCRAKQARNSWSGTFDKEVSPTVLLRKLNIRHGDFVANVKKLIATFGGVYSSIDGIGFRFRGRVPTEHCETIDQANHVIVLTGWAQDNDGKEYFIFRNSWGLWWGDNGYGKMYTNTDCGPNKNPFNSIEVFTMSGYEQHPYDNSQVPEDAYRMAVRESHKLNCTLSWSETINIKGGYFDNQEKFVSKCNEDATDLLKQTCANKRECEIKWDEINKKAPSCANQVTALWDCGALSYTTEAPPSTTPAPTEPAVKVECNYAVSLPGKSQGSGFCIDICVRAVDECAGHLTLSCMKEKSYEFYKDHLCDYSNTPVGKMTEKPAFNIDCGYAIGRTPVSDEYCVAKCKEIKKRYWCESSDYVCMMEAAHHVGTGRSCDLRKIVVKVGEEDESKKRRDALKTKVGKRSTIEDFNCNQVVPLNGYAGGHCVEICLYAIEICLRSPGRTMECAQNFLVNNKDKCDISPVETLKNNPEDKKVDCSKMATRSGHDSETCRTACRKALESCASNDFVCVLNTMDIGEFDFNKVCEYGYAWVSTSGGADVKRDDVKKHDTKDYNCNQVVVFKDNFPESFCIGACIGAVNKCVKQSGEVMDCVPRHLSSYKEFCDVSRIATTTGNPKNKKVDCSKMYGFQSQDSESCQQACRKALGSCAANDFACVLNTIDSSGFDRVRLCDASYAWVVTSEDVSGGNNHNHNLNSNMHNGPRVQNKLNCNNAFSSNSGDNDGYCVMLCAYGLGACRGSLTTECIQGKVHKISADCDVSRISSGMRPTKRVDCSKASSTSNQAGCIDACSRALVEGGCPSDDFPCVYKKIDSFLPSARQICMLYDTWTS